MVEGPQPSGEAERPKSAFRKRLEADPELAARCEALVEEMRREYARLHPPSYPTSDPGRTIINY